MSCHGTIAAEAATKYGIWSLEYNMYYADLYLYTVPIKYFYLKKDEIITGILINDFINLT